MGGTISTHQCLQSQLPLPSTRCGPFPSSSTFSCFLFASLHFIVVVPFNQTMRPAGLCDLHVVPSVALQASSVRPTTQHIVTAHIIIETQKIQNCLRTVTHSPHLTRLFPHPCIFTLSCQLLNHLFQPLEEAQIRNIPSEKESRPGDLSVQPPPRRQLQLQLALHLPDLHLQTPGKRDIL